MLDILVQKSKANFKVYNFKVGSQDFIPKSKIQMIIVFHSN